MVAAVLFVHNCVRFVPDEREERMVPAATPRVISKMVVPVAGVAQDQLVDTFTQSRGEGRPHDAIDILAARGTPVFAAAPGTVEKLFLSDRGGKTIYIRSPDRRLIYYYAHLDRYEPGLSAGRSVTAGQVLGTVGTTGNADPSVPHLHFAIHRMKPDEKWYQGVPINPYPLLMDGTR